MTDTVKQKAPEIWQAIEQASSILLHCHPSPDPDSVGSALAMYHMLKAKDKKVTVIKGDSELRPAIMTIPGANEITLKNFSEIDLNEFDLFIIQDSSNKEMITKTIEVNFPDHLNTIVIDHHKSNSGYGKINLIDDRYPAVCQIIFDLFTVWGISITQDIAACLFLGIYTDSGGFQYPPTGSDTFNAAAALAAIYPDYNKTIKTFFNNNDPERIIAEGLLLSSVSLYFSSHVAIASLSHQEMTQHHIEEIHTQKMDTANRLVSVIGWNIGLYLIERQPNIVSVSMRTRDENTYDLTKLALALGGGGHKGAAGAEINKPLEEAKLLLLEKIKETYPDLGNP